MLKSRFVILAAVTMSSAALSAPAFAQWADVGATSAGFNTNFRPAVTKTDDGTTQHVEVYAIEKGTNQVLQKELDITHGTQTGWNALGVPPGTSGVAASPTAVAWSGRRELFVIGSDLKLYRLYSVNGGAWTWQALGPSSQPLCTDPSATSWGPGRIDVFAGGCDDGNLMHVACANNGCNWEDRAAASTIYSVVATSYAGARLDVWVSEINASNWDLVDFQYDGSTWHVWKPGVTGGWFVYAGTPNPSVSRGTTNSGFDVTIFGNNLGKLWGASGTTDVAPAKTNMSDPLNQSPPIPQFAKPSIANEDWFGEVYLRDASNHVIRWQVVWGEGNGVYPGFFEIPTQTLTTGDTFATDPTAIALDGTSANHPIRVFAVHSNGHMYMGSDTAQ